MIIKNLGPINNLKIQIRPYTIFFGDNGTGKTFTEYIIYSLFKYIRDYKAKGFIPENEIDLLLQRKEILLDSNEVSDYLVKDISRSFNRNPKEFYDEIFADKTVYIEGKTKIIVEEEDIRNLIIHENNTIWSFRSKMPDGTKIKFISRRKGENLATKIVIEEESINETDAIEDKSKQLSSLNEVINRNREKLLEALMDLNYRLLFYRKNTNFLPAERIGINMFRKDLIDRRAEVSFETQGMPQSQLPTYPKPISDYLLFLNKSLVQLKPTEKKEKTKVNSYIKELIPGDFNYNSSLDSIMFSSDFGTVDFKLLSSSLKSLLGVDILLTSLKDKSNLKNVNDIIFIDEPEMNLHPKRQKLIADLLYTLSKTTSMTIVLSTHSDYFIKATINHLLREKKQGNYSVNNFAFYEFKDNTAKLFEDITDKSNVELKNFDDTTENILKEYYTLLGE